MSTGGAIGGILGAIIGALFAYFTGGLSIVAGALIGGSIGYTVGTIIDPQRPDVRTAGVPVQALQFMSNTIGDPLPDLLGTGKIIGHLLCFGKERTVATWQRTGGKGGSGSGRQFAGYNYYASWAVGICLGPIDSLYTIFRDSEEIVWKGEAIRPVSGGKQTIVLPTMGSVDFYFGTNDHALNPRIAETLQAASHLTQAAEITAGDTVITLANSDFFNAGDRILISGTAVETGLQAEENHIIQSITGFDATLTTPVYYSYLNPTVYNYSSVGEVTTSINYPFRRLAFAFFDDCLLGASNRIPSMQFVIHKSPVLAFSPFNQIQTFDYNPAHAMWYILKSMTGFPEQWLDSIDFADLAEKLALENRGISLLIDSLQACLNYIENINTHIDGILRYGSDGKFHPKLIRNDYDLSKLISIDESMLLDEPEISRKSWIDTVNEMKVQYSEITGTGKGIFTASYLGFVPLHLEVDGGFIYVCGQQAYKVGDNGYYDAVVRKIDIKTLEIVDEFNLHQATDSLNNAFYRVHVDGDDLYLVGSSYVDAKVQTVITRRNKNDLAAGSWISYYFLGNPSYSVNTGLSCITDDLYLYVTGSWLDAINHEAAWRWKLDKVDGSIIWEGNDFPYNYMTAYDGIVDDDPYVIIAGSAGGDRSILKVNKATNVSTIHNVSGDRYSNEGIVRDGTVDIVYYVCGKSYATTYGDFRVSVLKYNDFFIKVWEWTKNYFTAPPDLLEELLNCVIDTSGVYSIGHLQHTTPSIYYQGVFAKVSLDGSPLWDLQHETQYRAAMRAIGLLDADTLVVGTYDNDPSVSIVDRYGYLEKRLTSTGAIAS